RYGIRPPPIPTEAMHMRFYTQQHRFYCGVDLHARTLSLHILDQAGHTLLATTLEADAERFLQAIAPYRHDLVVCCKCLFCWYWQQTTKSARYGPMASDRKST